MITMAAMVMMLMAGVIRTGRAAMPAMVIRVACCGRRVRRRMVRVIHMRTHTPD